MTPNAMLAWRTLMDKLSKSSLGNFASGAGAMLLPSAEQIRDIPEGLGYAARHPIDSARLLGGGMQDAAQDQFEKMFLAPTLSEKIGHGAAGAIPMLGPAAAMAGEEIGAGNTARGLGMAAALLAPSAYAAAKPVVREVGLIKRAMNIDRIRRAKTTSPTPWNLTPEQAAGGRDALINLPEPPVTSGREGSLAQLRDDPTVPVPGMSDRYVTARPGITEPAPLLPSRRDALKAGGALAAAATLAPKLMETAAKAPEAALPPRGLAAPSALGREGFYRETKNRAVGYSDPYAVSDARKVPYLTRESIDFETGKPYPGEDPNNMSPRTSSGFLPDVENGMGPDRVPTRYPGERFILTRTEGVDSNGNPVYGKQVFRLNPKENLREALRAYTQNTLENEVNYTHGGVFGVSDAPPTLKRVVHSEITPEAAMRLNTIEKHKVPLYEYEGRGGTSAYKLIDDLGQTKAVAQVPNTKKAFNQFEREIMDKVDLHTSGAYNRGRGRRLKLEDTDWDIVPIDQSELEAVVDRTDHHGAAGNLSADRFYDRRNDFFTPPPGISPRYNKRVSIRLLKDTLEKQIAENKRAAGKVPPPLLAKPPLLSDNPLLTRQEFFAGLRKKP